MCQSSGRGGGALIGVKIRDLGFPAGCLIAIIRRGSEALVPSGKMVLERGDRLIVIGDIDGIAELKQKFTTVLPAD